MNRCKLADRTLPDYTRAEENFNFISHAVGGALSVAALVLCVVRAALYSDPWAVSASSIYGASLVLLYTISSVYHALRPPMAKKVMQVLDHCTIYLLIGGSYTPVALCSLRRVSPAWGWAIFGAVWGLCSIACVFTAIDLHKYSKLAMLCYVGMGWCILVALRPFLASVAPPGVILLIAGGVAYTVGAVLYNLGKKKRWMHSIFHLFVIVGSVLHFFSIYFYVI